MLINTLYDIRVAKLKAKLEELNPKHQEPLSHFEGNTNYISFRLTEIRNIDN